MKTVFNSALLIAGAIILASDIGYAYFYISIAFMAAGIILQLYPYIKKLLNKIK